MEPPVFRSRGILVSLVIGITGSIASGKSTACQYLQSKGATHCDADKLVHRMYDPEKPAFHRIVKAFGNTVVGDDGFIDLALDEIIVVYISKVMLITRAKLFSIKTLYSSLSMAQI